MQKLKNNEFLPKSTGSYKKSVYCTIVFKGELPLLLVETVLRFHFTVQVFSPACASSERSRLYQLSKLELLHMFGIKY